MKTDWFLIAVLLEAPSSGGFAAHERVAVSRQNASFPPTWKWASMCLLRHAARHLCENCREETSSCFSGVVGGNRRRDEKNDFFVPSAAPPTALGCHWKACNAAVASSSRSPMAVAHEPRKPPATARMRQAGSFLWSLSSGGSRAAAPVTKKIPLRKKSHPLLFEMKLCRMVRR